MKLRGGSIAAALGCLLWTAGCSVLVSAPSEQSVALPAAFGLREALDVSLAVQLEAETVESLRLIAAEHVHNSVLLRLPGLREEYRLPSPPPVESSLALLDGAIAYNHVLSSPPGTDLPDERRPRVKQLLELAGAENWAKLAAVREKIRLSGGIGTPELRQQEADLLLELRIATGLAAEKLLSFDFTSLPMPRECAETLAGLQRRAVRMRSETAPLVIPAGFPERIRQLYRSDPAAVPMLAEALYRLPRKLAELQLASPNRDLHKLAALGSAAGIIFEVELSYNRLREAWEAYEAARLRAEAAPDSPAAQTALTEVLLQWRIASFRLQAETGGDFTRPPAEGDGEPAGEGLMEELLTLLKER
ncbi:MAG: hypothetical protein HPZ91_12685 [Lentisphaeria bacterium]|nr:hypothetical protein [Lentisphaeria bacterium]